VAELGGLDVWVNNAGIYPFTELLEMADDDWRRVLSLNLDGVYWGCRAAGRTKSVSRTRRSSTSW